jgi:hypothetical protein
MATAANTNNVARALSENSRSKQTTEPVISFDKKKEPSIAKADATQSADAVPNEQIIKKEELNSLDAKKDTASANSKSSSVQNMPVVTDPPIPKESVVTDVKKVSEVKTEEGVYLSYSQKNGKNSDTVHVIIPSAPSSVSSENAGVASRASSKKDAVAAAPVASQSGKDEIKFLDVDPAVGKKKPVAEGTDKQENITKQDNTTLGNSNCKNVATDDDFTKLKRKMSMQTSDEKMIGEARKVYRLKCFTTSQIKGLSTLFLSDEGRLKFFDASYLSVADASLYATLQSEFIDPAYLQRFKALLQ